MLFRHVVLLADIPLQSSKDSLPLRQRLSATPLQLPQFVIRNPSLDIRPSEFSGFGDGKVFQFFT